MVAFVIVPALCFLASVLYIAFEAYRYGKQNPSKKHKRLP